jgi:hypothetical protein
MILTIKDEYVGQEVTLPILMETDAFRIEASASTGYTEVSKYLHVFVLEVTFGYIYEEVRSFISCNISTFNTLTDDEKDIVCKYAACVDGSGNIEESTINSYQTSKGRNSTELLNRSKKQLAAEQRSIGLLTSDTIDVIGKGVGSTKPTTNAHGDTTISEDFNVDNELYLHWVVPNDINTDEDLSINIAWFPTGSETSKVVSWELKYTCLEPGTDITTLTGTLNVVDQSVPSTANENSMSMLTIPAANIAGKKAIHFRLKRVTSTADSTSRIAVHHCTINYYLI